MASGLEMMLKASGIDIEKITADFVALKDGVTQTLEAIDTRLANIERQMGLFRDVQQLQLKAMEELWQKIQPQLQPAQNPQHPQPAAQPLVQTQPQAQPLVQT